MLTLKAVGFVSSGFLLIVIALMLFDLQLFALGIMILAFVAVTKLMRVKARIKRKLDTERILEGERVQVRVSVRNTGRREAMVVLYDELPPEVKLVEGSNRQAFILESGGKTSLRYTIECPLRGHYTVGPMRVRRRDFFNLYFEEETIENVSYFSVYPRVPELDKFPVRSQESTYFETMPLAQAGLGYEFFCIRDYIKGDPLKRINWKVYAKRRDLMVNEYEKENLNDALIILDARELTKVGTPLNNPLEYSIKMAASLANLLLKGRNQVGLLSYGGEKNSFVIPPSPGKNQLDEILGILVGIKAEGEESFKAALERAKPYLTPRTTIILISPLDEDDTVVEAAKEIMEGYRFIVFSPNSYEIEREVAGVFSSKHTMLVLEKRNLVNELRDYGVTTIPISVGDSTANGAAGEVV
jgi:uncharacterized protein (DUF58 family)